jgi:hypothetical protein
MAQKLIACPDCKQQVAEDAASCSSCGKHLKVLSWEIESASGEKLHLTEPDAVPSIRDQLIAGKLTLSDHCRQFIKALERVEADQDVYGIKKEREWKTLRDYASKSFELQVLYDPINAYDKQTAQIVTVIVGAIMAVGWNTEALLGYDANPIIAVLLSIFLLLTTPTVVGLLIASFIVSLIYDLPAFAMAFRSLAAIFVGGLAGLVVGWPVGYLIGMFIGLSKAKVFA